jgi:hypothetical protein
MCGAPSSKNSNSEDKKMEVLCVGGMGGLLCVRSQVPSTSPQVPVGRDIPRERC